MRSALRAAILALAVLVGTAAPAAGASSATTIHLPQGQMIPVAGPVFAGDAVAFGRPMANGYEVVVRRGAHAAISRVPLPQSTNAYERFLYPQLEASDRRLVLGLTERVCETRKQCDTPGGARFTYSAVLTGGLDGGKLTRLAGCTNEAQCSAHPKCRPGPVDVSGDVVAWSGCPAGVHVRDLTPGADPAGRDYPAPSYGPRLADPFVAYVKNWDDSSSNIQVSNWRTGADAYSIATGSSFPYDLQSDGKLVYMSSREDRAWASPAEPFAHVWSRDLLLTKGLRIAHDLLAHETYGSGYEGTFGDHLGSRLGVHDLSAAPPPDSDQDPGSVAGVSDPWAISSFDFDGTRLTWITRVCRRSWLTVWDIADARPPNLPRGPCPWPSIAPGSVRVDAKKRFHVTLECPADPPVGCLGFVAAEGHSDVRYSIPAGERATKQLGSGGLCRDAAGRVRVKIFFEDQWGYGWFHKTVTVHGATGQLQRC